MVLILILCLKLKNILSFGYSKQLKTADLPEKCKKSHKENLKLHLKGIAGLRKIYLGQNDRKSWPKPVHI